MLITAFPALLFFTACLLLALVRPKIAIYLPLIFSSAYLIKARIFGLPSTLLEIILIAVLSAVFIVNFHRIRVRPCRQGRTLMGIMIILFVVAVFVSTFVSPHLHTSFGVLKALIVEPIIYALALVVFVDKEKRADNVTKALLLGGFVGVLASLFVPGFGVDFGRFRGIYDVPNSLALIVAPLSTIGLVGVVLRRGGRLRPPTFYEDEGARGRAPLRTLFVPRLLYGIAGLVFGIVLIVTQSLAGLLAVSVTVLGIIILRKRGWILLVVFGLIIVLGIGFQATTGKITHLFNPQSSSLIAREQIWYTALRMIKKHPVLGAGLGTFEPAYQNELRLILDSKNTINNLRPPLEWVVRDPHNIILSFWLNTGLLGFSAMSVLVFSALKNFLKALREEKNASLGLLGGALVTLLVFGLFDVPYWKNDLALIWWAILTSLL